MHAPQHPQQWAHSQHSAPKEPACKPAAVMRTAAAAAIQSQSQPCKRRESASSYIQPLVQNTAQAGQDAARYVTAELAGGCQARSHSLVTQQEAAQSTGAASMIFSSWPARVRKEGRDEGLTSQQASMRPRHSGSHQCGTSGAMLPTIRPATAKRVSVCSSRSSTSKLKNIMLLMPYLMLVSRADLHTGLLDMLCKRHYPHKHKQPDPRHEIKFDRSMIACTGEVARACLGSVVHQEVAKQHGVTLTPKRSELVNTTGSFRCPTKRLMQG